MVLDSVRFAKDLASVLSRDIGLQFPCGIFGSDIGMIWILQDRLGSVPSFTFLMGLNFK